MTNIGWPTVLTSGLKNNKSNVQTIIQYLSNIRLTYEVFFLTFHFYPFLQY
jgi:hypothetical protein